MKEIYEKFKGISMPTQFSLEEADEILKKEYSAMKVDKRDFDFLNLELNYNFVMSYKFENKKILQRLFTTREKKAFLPF